MNIVFDIEADGLLDKVTKIHCFSYCNIDTMESQTLTKKEDIILFFKSNQNLHLIGHNIINYDIPVLEKILGIKFEGKITDTLALSWYLFPEQKSHGLEYWGERLNIKKPEIKDWKNLELEQYVHRCEEDVKINTQLYLQFDTYLKELYQGDYSHLNSYLTFKMFALKDRSDTGIQLDEDLCVKTFLSLQSIFRERTKNLSQIMPKQVVKTRPKNFYKKNGEISIAGKKWQEDLKMAGEDEKNTTIETLYKPGNPGSSVQLKDWLFSLGWKPKTFKLSKNTGENVPQISLPFGQGLCESVKDLFEDTPSLELLSDYFMLRHRMGILKGFLEKMDATGKIYSTCHGFTNTLRLKHSKPIVNLPGVDKPYGKEIRACLTVPDSTFEMCGFDISGLEDTTKQHYIYIFDPEYVNHMRVPGFDPHLDIAVLANLMTKEDSDLYKELEKKDEDSQKDASLKLTEEEKKQFKKLKKIRSKAKQINFSAIYGAGAKKISESLKCPLEEAQTLHTTYWNRNKAVKQVVKEVTIKKVSGQLWLYNPISSFWVFVKNEKDIFSTLNQSSGVFVFDSFLRNVITKIKPLNIKVSLEYHDEGLIFYNKYLHDFIDKALKEAIEETNKKITLNVPIEISISYGKDYAECH